MYAQWQSVVASSCARESERDCPQAIEAVTRMSRDVAQGVLGAPAMSEAGRQGAHVVDMQRRRLLLALTEVVAGEGLDGASIGAICKRAGVSRRTFYEIFEDREACVLAAFDNAVKGIAKSVLGTPQGESKWGTRVRAGLTVLLEYLDSEPALARLCVIETLRAGPEVIESRKRVLDVLISIIEEGRRESRSKHVPPPLTGEGVVGGVMSVVHARLLEEDSRPLVELTNPLMAMIVHPYLGPAAAQRELDRPTPHTQGTIAHGTNDPFKDFPIRITYRTALVLATIARAPHASNRHIAETSGVTDEGQMSRLLTRLQRAGLIQNKGDGQSKGEPNAWTLTARGRAINQILTTPS
jgi:AcrR family transcriptional regulator